ncbi:hypothetical protein [Streptosporangium canum]|uniref:hypothetical protein n=1 Tax=Streptosporangium canum TaxID=324952 RepID=UPI00379E6F7D
MDAESRPKWQRLGKLLAERRARIDPRYATRKVFAAEVGVGHAVLRDIEIAARDNFTAPTIAAIEAAYRWAPGSIERVLAGGDPVEVSSVSGTASMALSGAATTTAHRTIGSLDVLAAPEAALTRRPPRWFTSEVERRGWDLDHLTLSQLQVLAQHFHYSLAELLLHADLASGDDLEVEERPASPPEGEALADFDARVKRMTSSPFLSKRQRKEFEDLAERAREEVIKKIRGTM